MENTAYLGSIRLFAGSFAPVGWLLCNGQLLSISDNQALFSILGTTYGGNGTTTFGLPNLRGRAALGAGNALGVPIVVGQNNGSPTAVRVAPAPTGGVQLTSLPYLNMNYIICSEGIYPPRY